VSLTLKERCLAALDPQKGKELSTKKGKAMSSDDAPRERGRPARIGYGTMETILAMAGLVPCAREWPWTAGCLQE